MLAAIVRRRPLEERRICGIGHKIPVAYRANIPRLAHVTYARIARGHILANLRRSIRGRIVRDDQLIVLESLLSNALERFDDILLTVVHGQPDADFGSTVVPRSSKGPGIASCHRTHLL